MARSGADLKAVVTFHANLSPVHSAKRNGIAGRLLVYQGIDDAYSTPEDTAAFTKEMTAANARMVMIQYSGAKHAFTDSQADFQSRRFNLPLAYSVEADRQSWEEMMKYLGRYLRS